MRVVALLVAAIAAGSVAQPASAQPAQDSTPSPRCGSTPGSQWCAYRRDIRVWSSALQRYVDSLSSDALVGTAPALPDVVLEHHGCSGVQALRACRHELTTWQAKLNGWLSANHVGGVDAAGMPSMPAPRGFADERTVTEVATGLFALTSAARSDAPRVDVQLVFEHPLNGAQVQAISRQTDSAVSPALVIEVPLGNGEVARAGVSGAGDAGLLNSFGATALTAAGQLQRLIGHERDTNAAWIAELQSASSGLGKQFGVAEVAAAKRRAITYQRGLNGSVPTVVSLQSEMDAHAALAAATAPRSPIEAVVAASTPPASAAAPSNQAALPKAAASSIAAAGIGDHDYMPSNWAARTFPYGAANRFGWHLKRTDLLFSWKTSGSQNYFDRDPGNRGFEAEAYPVGSRHYSRTWASYWSWQPATANTYRDDLFEDGANPHFALGAARGNLLAYNTIYSARWDTDAQYPSIDTGTAQLDGQATARRPTNLYCVTHLRRDSACMFATATHVLGTYPLSRSFHYWVYP